MAQAWSDDNLKQRLITDPAIVLQEHGIEVPDGVEFKVVEDTDQVYHLVLPASPEGELSDEELTCSVGFDSWCGGCGGCGCGRCGCGCRRCACD
ncbi:MAG TPA: NHLP leader peptide family RiPP precursor [Pirellulales bacterium]|nr:NHLP leader peptide family RiPP precursor [Pirellulales bacterium]